MNALCKLVAFIVLAPIVFPLLVGFLTLVWLLLEGMGLWLASLSALWI